MRKIRKNIISVVLAFACTICAVNVASAAGYTAFDSAFNYTVGMPTSSMHISQTVTVQGGANANAHAKCTSYSFSGSRPVLTVVSASSAYPTNSTSFTGTSDGRAMKYTEAIPPTNKTVKFKGTVSNYSTSFAIEAAVKG